MVDGNSGGAHQAVGGVAKLATAEGLKPSVRKDLQVRILPPLPSPSVLAPAGLAASQFAAYSYLLGMYLGDGYICRLQRTYRFHVSLHHRQEWIIRRVTQAIATLRPGRPVGFRRRGAEVIVNAYSNAWPILFPQHGPGRKHLRPIILESWQREIIERHPTEFVRGCLESDGCRHRRLVGGRNYPAYSFKNHSADILALFVWACGLLGLRPRRANRVTISIARRADVARLDHVVEHDGTEHAPPTLREAMASYRLRSNDGNGLPMRKCAMPTSS